MRIAVTYDHGNVFQHFGHTSLFKIYDIENGEIVKELIAPASGSGHSALAGLLTSIGVNTLICGGIGSGAYAALTAAGIQVLGGVQGSVDDAVKAFLGGELSFDPNTQVHNCSGHHEDGHECHHN